MDDWDEELEEIIGDRLKHRKQYYQNFFKKYEMTDGEETDLVDLYNLRIVKDTGFVRNLVRTSLSIGPDNLISKDIDVKLQELEKKLKKKKFEKKSGKKKKFEKKSAKLFDFSTVEGYQSGKQASASKSVLLTTLSKCFKEISSDKNFTNAKLKKMRKKLKIDDLLLDNDTPNGNISKLVDASAVTPTFICSTPKQIEVKASNKLIGSKSFVRKSNSSKKENSTKKFYKTKHSSLKYADETSRSDVLGKHLSTPTNQQMSTKTISKLEGIDKDDLGVCMDSFSLSNSPNMMNKKRDSLSSCGTLTVNNTPKNIPLCDLTF